MEKPQDSPRGNTPAAKIAQRIADELEKKKEVISRKDTSLEVPPPQLSPAQRGLATRMFQEARQVQRILAKVEVSERLTHEDCRMLLAQAERIIKTPEATPMARTIANKVAAELRDILSNPGMFPYRTKQWKGVHERAQKNAELIIEEAFRRTYHVPAERASRFSHNVGEHEVIVREGYSVTKINKRRIRAAKRYFDEILEKELPPPPPTSTTPEEHKRYARSVHKFFVATSYRAIRKARTLKGLLRGLFHL